MNSINFLTICVSSFMGVFTLLAILALVMRIIVLLFPEKAMTIDETLVAAISTVAVAAYPNKKVTKIEEIK